MPRPRKPARLWLEPARYRDGQLVAKSVWYILDGGKKRSTGCVVGEIGAAEEALTAYIQARKAERPVPRERNRRADEIAVADVLDIYATDVVPNHADSDETDARIGRLTGFFGTKLLSEIDDALCQDYVKHRGGKPVARRELEDLRAAVNHHRKRGYCRETITVTLPAKAPPRDRWLTRSEIAKLVWSAWRHREKQNLRATDRYTRRHIARFILVALYSGGTRAGAVTGAALEPIEGRGFVDLEHGVFYRRPARTAETKKRRPPVRLPDRLLAHLRRWKEKGQKFAVEWNGRPVDRLNKAFNAVVKDAGLGREVTPHVLRHTAATWLMQQAVPTHEAAGFAGMSVETMERVYAHHHPDFQSNATGAFDRPHAKAPRTNVVRLKTA
ncbi:MAG: site-specific integrase [Bauldia sp.]|nr:site-specific integrase [Bauldia sp.]